MVMAGALTHMRFTAQARLRRLFGLSGPPQAGRRATMTNPTTSTPTSSAR